MTKKEFNGNVGVFITNNVVLSQKRLDILASTSSATMRYTVIEPVEMALAFTSLEFGISLL